MRHADLIRLDGPKGRCPCCPTGGLEGAGARGLEAGGVLCLTEGDTESPEEVAHGGGECRANQEQRVCESVEVGCERGRSGEPVCEERRLGSR